MVASGRASGVKLCSTICMVKNKETALSTRHKRVQRISGDPVHGVGVQGTMDGLTTCSPGEWRFCTWNVGSLTGRSLEVAEELWRRRVDVCAVQETRWKGESARLVGARGMRYKLWWKGNDGTGGVGVMVKEELAEKVLEVRRKSVRVMVVVMVIGNVTMRVISGYAPQQNSKVEEKVQFYDDVSEEIGQAGSDEFVVMLGDMNGHVGAGADGYEGVHGGWGYGARNEEGRRVLELADAYGMVVGNTLFKKEPARLITYRSGENMSMIDYVLVKAKDRKYVKNVKAIRGLLQHSMVVMDVVSKEMGKRRREKFVPRRKTWKLQDAEVRKTFEVKVAERWDRGCNDGDVWERYRDCVLDTADEVCGWTKGKGRHGETWWWDEDTRKVLEDKKERFRQWNKDRTVEAKSEYKKAKRSAKQAVAIAMKKASDKLMNELEAGENSMKMFKIAKQSMKDRKDMMGNGCVRDRFGKLCTDERERAQVWKDYMEKVMNEENEWDGDVEVDVTHGPIERVTMEEVAKAIKEMKLGKAAGVSEVAAEHIKASGMVGIEVIMGIANRMLDGEGIPEDWRHSVLVPLYKGKGDVRDCGSYRGVKLLEHGMKVVERVFERRLRNNVTVNEMQCGFMPGKGTVDALFMARMLQEKYGKKKRKLYMCFVDLEKAFDRVPRKVIEWALRKKGVNENLVRVVMQLYEGAKTKVKVGKGMSEAFSVKVGVHQGSVLSPFLFAIVMDVVCGDVMEGLLFEILYADDLVLMAESMEELQLKFDRWRGVIEKKGMKVNMGKTKVMVSGEGGERVISSIDPCGVCDKRVKANSVLCIRCQKWVHKRCSGVKGALKKVEGIFKCKRCVHGVNNREEAKTGLNDGIERVESFVYLGDKMNADGGCLSAVTARVRVGWMKFRELSGVLCGRKWSKKMKGRVFKACVRAAMVYGGETWVMRKEEEGVLQRAERAMVRMMCGVKLKDRKSSMELRSMVGLSEDIVTWVRRSRLRWYGHVLRRNEGVGIRRALEFEVEGVTGRGRPRLGWREQVEKDRVKAGLWNVEASDRCAWQRGVLGFHHR